MELIYLVLIILFECAIVFSWFVKKLPLLIFSWFLIMGVMFFVARLLTGDERVVVEALLIIQLVVHTVITLKG